MSKNCLWLNKGFLGLHNYGVFKGFYWRFFLVTYGQDYISAFFSTGPKRRDGAMENLDFENFFGSSVAIHKKKAVSCAYRELPKGKSYVNVQSTMGEIFFFHPLF